MRTLVLFTVVIVATWYLAPAGTAIAAPLEVDYMNYYYNESIQTANLPDQPRMLRNISNSRMTSAPNYLQDAIYLQRRTSPWSGLEGIAELSQEWLRGDHVTISDPAVVVVAVREPFYPGAGSLLTSLGWTPLGDTITLGYVADAAQLTLYAGLVNAGPVQISGAGVDALLDHQVANSSTHHYFFFQNAAAFSPTIQAQLQLVSVPEPNTLALVGAGLASLLTITRRRSARTMLRRALAGNFRKARGLRSVRVT